MTKGFASPAVTACHSLVIKSLVICSSPSADHKGQSVQYDVIVIGGGPAGLSAALVLGRARRRVLVIDSGCPRNAAAEAMHGYLGYDGRPPLAFLEQGRKEISRYGVEFLSDTVTSAERLPIDESYLRQHPCATAFSVATRAGRTATCRKLLFASGVCDEMLQIPGLTDCYGQSVHHCPYCDGWEHRDERLLALGSTAEKGAGLALLLRTWSSQVTVLLNADSLADDYRQRLVQHNIAVCEPRVLELVHRNGRLQGVRLATNEILAADALFFNTGHRAQCSLPLELGCEQEKPGVPETSSRQHTSQQGIYLAGDACEEVQFVIVAAAEGATAAVAINKELNEEDMGDV
jgi:thioredoxin reductase